MNNSITLLTLGKSEIDLWQLHRSLDSLLQPGTTLAIFGADGKILFERNLLLVQKVERI